MNRQKSLANRERLDEVQFSLHPNPVSHGGSLKVRLTLPKAGRLQFRLLDIGGRRVRSFDLGEKGAASKAFRWTWQAWRKGFIFSKRRCRESL